MAEIANAWISIVPETSKIAPGIKKALGQAEPAATASGQSLGSKLAGGIAKTLKVGAASAGVAAGGVFATGLAKGMGRLEAIGNAEAKLMGLGNSAATVAGVMDNALNAVKGTSHGLGEAATAASGLVAAGIKPGKELESALSTIASTASVAGRSMQDVGVIFGSVAARGKLQGDDMLQLMSAGVPVIQMLAEETGKTSAEISAMVSKGEIDFATFERALGKSMGGAAKVMGETFSGTAANFGSALGRVGASMLKPLYDAGPSAFKAGTALADAFGEGIKPASERVGKILTPALAGASAAVAEKLAPGIERLATGFGDLAVKATEIVVDPATWERIGGVFEVVGSAAETMGPSLFNIAESLLKITSSIGVATWQAFGEVLQAVTPIISNVLVPLLEQVATLAAENPGLVQAMVTGFLGFKAVGAISGPVGTAAKSISGFIGTAKSMPYAAKTIGGAFSQYGVKSGFGQLGMMAKSSNPLLAKLGGVIGKVSKVLGPFAKAIGAVAKVVAPVVKVLGTVVRFINPWVAGFTLAAGALTWFFTKTETGQKVWAGFIDVLQSAWQWLSSSFAAVWDTLKGKVTGFVDGVSRAWETFKAGIDGVKAIWQELTGAFSGEATGGPSILSRLIGEDKAQTVLGVFTTLGQAWDVLKTQGLLVVDALKLGWEQLTATFTAVFDAIKVVVTSGWEQIKNIFATAWLTIRAVFTGQWQEIPGILAAGWEAIKSTAAGAFDALAGIVGGWVSGTVERFSQMWDTVTQLFTTAKDTIVNGVSALVDAVIGWFVQMHNTLVGKVTEIATNVVAKFAEMRENAITTVREMPGRIKAVFADAGSWLVNAGKNILNGLWSGLKSKWAEVANWLSSIRSRITSAFDGAASAQVRYSTGAMAAGGVVPGYAGGGRLPVSGPGTHKVDGILGVDYQGMPVARVNAGEFVVNRAMTEKFLPLLHAINGGKLDPRRGDMGLPAYANGGVVSAVDLLRFARGEAVGGAKAPHSLEGSRYVWGGGLLGNWGDCSGAMSGFASLAAGVAVAGRKFATMTQGAWLAAHKFVRGMGGKDTFSVGYFNGGPYGGHTSGTITDSNGARTNVEMGGGRGNGQIGGRAAPANHPQYTDVWHIALKGAAGAASDALVSAVESGVASTSVEGVTTNSGAQIDWGLASSLASKWDEDQKRRSRLAGLGLPWGVFDTGGVFRPGTAAINLSGKPEVVINNNQLSAINKLANNVGALVNKLGTNMATFGQTAGIKDWMGIAKMAGFGQIVEYIEPTVAVYEKLQDSLLVQQDAAKAVTQAEGLLGQARAKGDPAGIAAAEQELAKARGVAVQAAKAAGFAQIELVLTIVQTIGKIFRSIWEGQMKAAIGVRKAIADSTKAVADWMELVNQQRETVSKLQQQVVNDQIALTKANWDLRLAQTGVVRAQLDGVKSVAQAEAKLKAERDRQARKAARDWNDLTTAYDRYRHAEKMGMAARLGEMVAVTPEILALEHEVSAARLAGLAKTYSAQLASLEAAHAQQMAAFNLAQSQLQLTQQSALLAQMQQQYFGMSQSQALTGANTAQLYAEKAAAEGRANRGFLGWIGSFFTDPLGTLKYAFGGGAKADRQYAAALDKQIAERTANGKGVMATMSPELEAQVKKLYGMGLTEQAENLIKASALGDPARALQEAREDQMILAMKQQEESLRDSQRRLEALVAFESKAQPLREQIAAFESGSASHQYSADALRENNPAVKAALEALAIFEADNSKNYAASARGETVVEINVPPQDVYTREQMDALLAAMQKVPGLELRLEKIENPRPSATDVMATVGG